MSQVRRITTSVFAFIASASVASYGHAQGNAPPSPASGGLEEMTVTANKREESLSKVGLTVTALGGPQLEQRRVATLQDLTAAVPGLIYTQTETATPVITLRGIGFYDSSLAALPAVTVYMDQAPLPFPVEASLALFDLERVEVLKGPQGTLFGNNATGGAINYVAAKPTRDPEGGISLTYGRFNTFDTDAYISGPLNDQLAARVAIKTSNGDGWQKSATQPGVVNGAPDNFAGRFLLDWEPTNRLHVQINVNGWRYGTEPEQGQFVAFIPSFTDGIPKGSLFKLIPNANNNPQSADWTTGQFSPKADNTLFQATVRVDYDVTDAIVLTSITSYTDYSQRQSPIGTGLNANRSNFYEDDGSIINRFEEVRLSQNKDPVFRWTIGANYEHDDMSEFQYLNASDGTAYYTPDFFGVVHEQWSDATSLQSADTYAGFANAEYTLGQLTFKGGLRYTEYDRSAENCTYAINNDPLNIIFQDILGRPTPFNSSQCFSFSSITFQPGQLFASISEHNLSWRAGLDWKPADNILAYANVAKGYKGGSLPTLTGTTQTSFQAAKQESVLTEEIGAKLQFFDRRLFVNVAAYHSGYDNKQIKSKLYDPVFAYLPALVNVPKSVINGAELEISARPVESLTVGASANFVDSELKNTIGPNGAFLISNANSQVNAAGNPIPYSPKWSLAGNFNYDFPIGTARGFFGGQVQYRSKTNASIAAEPIEDIPSYYTIDLQAGADFSDGKYRVMFWGKNLLNEFYITNRNFSYDGVVQFPGMPLTYGVTLTAKF